MQIMRDLYHGTNGDNILEIMRLGVLKPNIERKLFFSEWRCDSVLMYGADVRRKASFAVKLRIAIGPSTVLQRAATEGVSDTLIVSTTIPLRAEVLELFVRDPRASSVRTIRGAAEIKKYLSA